MATSFSAPFGFGSFSRVTSKTHLRAPTAEFMSSDLTPEKPSALKKVDASIPI